MLIHDTKRHQGNDTMRHVHTIGPEDVGRHSHKIAGRSWLVSDWIGRVLPSDIGKRVFLTEDCTGRGILSVENDVQRDRRISRREWNTDESRERIIVDARECARERADETGVPHSVFLAVGGLRVYVLPAGEDGPEDAILTETVKPEGE